jgi:DNA polymerase elongation subunit (family B)
MTKEELIAKINKLKRKRDELKNLSNVQDLKQHAFKIFLNSSYGALGSAFYPCFDLDNAEAVTLSGQSITREMVRYTNEFLNKLSGTENEEYVVAGDTDSVSGYSKLIVNGKEYTIEKFFALLVLENNPVDILENGTQVVNVKNKKYLTQGLTGSKNIKNVSRHKVTKERWEVLIPGKERLSMTGDHSIIVYREGKIIECKPRDILPTDYLIVRK